MYMHEERINKSNMDWCYKLATNQWRTTFKNQATMFVGLGPCPRTLSSPRTGNDDRGLQDNGLWKGFGHEELNMLSEEKYVLRWME